MIQISEKAVAVLKDLLKQYHEKDYALRLQIVSGDKGSGGLRMILDETTAGDDIVLNQQGIRVLVDPSSYAYLSDARIDFISTPAGEGFSIQGPSFQSCCGGGHDGGCGCGNHNEEAIGATEDHTCGCHDTSGTPGESGCGCTAEE